MLYIRRIRLCRSTKQDDGFEWDDAKAAVNLARHGVSFEAVRQACNDAFAGVREDRYVLPGMAQARLLCVAYTLKGERIRITSARLAEAQERRRYHAENSQD